MVIAIAVLVIVAIAAVVGIALRRQRGGSAAAAVIPPRVPRPEPEPMTDLEDALAQVTDRSGTSMRDRLDSTEVDELRVTDDTGPLLRRALDHVHPGDAPGEGPADGPRTAEPATDPALDDGAATNDGAPG